jgi:hypothetical protein
MSWGLFTFFGGILVDYFSDGGFEKNYVPIYYLCLIIIICDLMVAYNIEVSLLELLPGFVTCRT